MNNTKHCTSDEIDRQLCLAIDLAEESKNQGNPAPDIVTHGLLIIIAGTLIEILQRLEDKTYVPEE